MFKYYISITTLGIFVLALIITGIIIAGNPISRKAIQLDEIRVQAFNGIKFEIENYYKFNRKLSTSLTELKSPIIDIQDPETKNDYEYKTQLPYGYQLCATFSTDNSEIIDRSGYSNYDSDSASYKKHKKGYDCMTFKLSNSVISSAENSASTIPSVLNVKSMPEGIVMTPTMLINANVPQYNGTTNYTRTKNGVINVTLGAPSVVLIGGVNYYFESWAGCNNDTVVDSYCAVLVDKNTITVVANYTTTKQSLPTPTPIPSGY